MQPYTALTTQEAAAMFELRRQGANIAQLFKTFGVSPPTIRNYLAEQRPEKH